MRWVAGRWWVVAVLVAACGGPIEKADAPKPKSAVPPDDNALHTALVDVHKRAVEACFGGFGKGAPYAVSMTLADGAIASAEATPLSDSHGELPKSCLEKNFVGQSLPDAAQAELRARFAVENPTCELPACPAKDLPCTFKRDIACTVIID